MISDIEVTELAISTQYDISITGFQSVVEVLMIKKDLPRMFIIHPSDLFQTLELIKGSGIKIWATNIMPMDCWGVMGSEHFVWGRWRKETGKE